jgi:chitodextrinase
VAGYRVFRDDTLIASTASTAFTDRGLTSNTSYRYFVRAIDKKGNISSNSNTVTVTTKDSFFGEIRVGPGGE